MKHPGLFLIVVFFNVVAFATTIEITYTAFGEIQGKVVDDLKNPIHDANIVVLRNDNIIAGTASDAMGYYSVRVDPGMYTIKVSAINHTTYIAKDIVVTADAIRFLSVELTFAPNILDTFVVGKPLVPVVDIGEVSPGPRFEKDWIESSGAKSVSDLISGSAGVYQSDDGARISLMGSRPEHTATYMDGMRIFGNLNIPMQAIEQVKVSLTGISAKYGDVIGGVIEISTSKY